MTDRELLELAAKAAVISLDFSVRGDFPPYYINERGGHSSWNPLTDDGDALRLAVRKFFHVCVFAASDAEGIKTNGFVEVWREADSDPLVVEYVTGGDYGSATRRAIVRAAAEIGKGIK